jgi:microcystin-dependent protein
LADADTEATSSKTIGILESGLAVNAIGYVVTEGLVAGLNTATATAGQSVWLSSTAGGFVYGAPPAEPAHSVYLGVVTRANSSNGEIFVKVQNGYELDELHDVSAASPADKNILSFVNSTQMWTKSSRLTDLEAIVSALVPSGVISQYAGASAPSGYLLCEGQTVSRATYASLFTAIGTAYGAGDGSTTFALPNLKGRIPVGKDSAQTEFDVLGETGGAKTHTLTTTEMPSHTHTGTTGGQSAGHTHTFSGTTTTNGYHNHINGWASITGFNYVGSGNSPWPFGSGGPAAQRDLQWDGNHNHTFSGTTSGASSDHTHSFTTASSGSGSAHNNLQPYITVNYIIKT